MTAGKRMAAFIEWKGGECPVDPDALVECVFGDGSMDVHPAHVWDWNSKRSPIIGYRLTPAGRRAIAERGG